MRDKSYWNPFLETFPREELVEVQLRRFRQALNHAIRCSPMYKEKFRGMGLTAEDVKSLDDVRKISLTEK